MQTSELRHELHRLADEMEPFPGDLLALRRRERRRSALLRVAAAFVVVLTVAGAVALWNRGEKHVGVAKKEYAPADVRLDLVVVPGTERVRQVLEDSPVVARYAPLARGGPRTARNRKGHRPHHVRLLEFSPVHRDDRAGGRARSQKLALSERASRRRKQA